MDWIYGISRCWTLSRTCGIDWEAWSAILAGGVGLLAWRTAVQAKGIAETATEIARQQHEEVRDQRDGTARILARLLVAELSMLPIKIEHALTLLREARRSFDSAVWSDEPSPFKVVSIASDLPTRLAQIRLDGAEVAEPRLHTLPPVLGNRLSLLISLVRGLHVAANIVNGQLLEQEGRFYYRASRGLDNLRALDVMLMRTYSDAVSCARSLQEYVEMAVREYPPLDPTESLDS